MQKNLSRRATRRMTRGSRPKMKRPKGAAGGSRPNGPGRPDADAMGDQIERHHRGDDQVGGPGRLGDGRPGHVRLPGFTWWVATQVLGPQDPELRSSHTSSMSGDGRLCGSPEPGDLVFFNTTGAVCFGNLASHVGMMIDAERFIHAANEARG